MKSVALNLSTTEYARLRIGVGRGELRRDLAAHVLAGFDADEAAGVTEAIARSADAVELWIAQGLVPVMNTFNRPEEV